MIINSFSISAAHVLNGNQNLAIMNELGIEYSIQQNSYFFVEAMSSLLLPSSFASVRNGTFYIQDSRISEVRLRLQL